MAIKSVKVAADFETTTTPDDLRVWASCAVDINTGETSFMGNDIDSFFNWLKDKNSVCYFHNLKFDGEFILAYLLRHGYKYSDSREPMTFSTLITDTGLFYSITVIFDRMNKKYKKVTFYDSLKKLPFKVSVIAKAFNLKDEKLTIDYDEYRAPGHELTQEEIEYITADCRIVAGALKTQFEAGLTKMTNASDAMSNYKESIGKKQFERLFPVLPLALDSDIRRAYKGGFTFLNPKHKYKRGLKGITLDVNSLYPSVMYYNVLPYGYPMYFEGVPDPDETYNLYIVRLECAFELKKDHIPTLQLKNNRAFVETEYLTSSGGEIVEMTLTNVDLALMLDHYDVYDLKYINGYKFKGTTGLFKDYIDYWMHIKETTTGAMRQLAKLMLNSLYGKFASNPMKAQKTPVLDSDGVVRYEYTEEEESASIYTAMAAFITAYARDKTIRSAQNVYHRFIYADTDSLHLIGFEIPEGLEIHPTKLGAWKHEGNFIDSKYIRAKTYMETMLLESPTGLKYYVKMLCDDSIETVYHKDGKIYGEKTIVTCAGMPDNVKLKVNYDNFTPGSTFDGKLVPKRYPGGVVLESTTFTIK